MNNEQALLEDEALQWIVTLTSGNATPDQIAACKQWRQQSEQHEQAFILARDLWLKLGQSEQFIRTADNEMLGQLSLAKTVITPIVTKPS